MLIKHLKCFAALYLSTNVNKNATSFDLRITNIFQWVAKYKNIESRNNENRMYINSYYILRYKRVPQFRERENSYQYLLTCGNVLNNTTLNLEFNWKLKFQFSKMPKEEDMEEIF